MPKPHRRRNYRIGNYCIGLGHISGHWHFSAVCHNASCRTISKSGVTDPCRYEPGINPSYQEWAEHYGVAILPARPYKPRDKVKVEKAVQEVERQVLAPLRHEQFSTLEDLNAAIAQKLKALNERTMHGYGVSRRVLFEQVDQPALSALPVQPFTFAHWKTAKVNHIEVDKHYYSVPYWFVQHEVRVKVSEQMVEIFHDGKRIAAHERRRLPHPTPLCVTTCHRNIGHTNASRKNAF